MKEKCKTCGDVAGPWHSCHAQTGHERFTSEKAEGNG